MPDFIIDVYASNGEASPVIGGGSQPAPPPADTQTQTETGTAPATPPAEDEPAPTSVILPTLLMYGVLFFAFYMLLFRPQRKKTKELKNLQNSIRAGDNIVTQSGLFGKVTDVGEDCYVVEFGTNRGVKVPVLKSEVAAIRSPKLTPPPAAPATPPSLEK